MLSKEQVEFFNANGYLVVEDAVTPDHLDALRQDFAKHIVLFVANIHHSSLSKKRVTSR